MLALLDFLREMRKGVSKQSYLFFVLIGIFLVYYNQGEAEEVPVDNIKIKPKPVVDNKIETNNEVERALEELKKQLFFLHSKYSTNDFALVDSAILKRRLETLTEKAQNLVKALEAEESAMNVVKDALKEGIRNMKDFNAKMDEKYPMSKPEPKIDMKEERVEPASIWKDVSELPSCYTEVLLRDDSSIVRGYYYPENGFFTILSENKDRSVGVVTVASLKKYCTVTDFINSFEQMQKDIEELKKCQ